MTTNVTPSKKNKHFYVIFNSNACLHWIHVKKFVLKFCPEYYFPEVVDNIATFYNKHHFCCYCCCCCCNELK